MKKRFSETGPLPPFLDVATIENELNVLSDGSYDIIGRHDDIAEDLDTARASLAEIVSSTGGNVDELTEEGTALTVRIQVLASQLEAARLALVESLRKDAQALSDKIAMQRAYHVETRTKARASVAEWARERFEKRAAGMIEMMHSKDSIAEKNSRIILDTLAARQSEIRDAMKKYATNAELAGPGANAFYGSNASSAEVVAE